MSFNKSGNRKAPSEIKIMQRLALVEQSLAKLKSDFEAAAFRRNRVVEDGITRGFDVVGIAVEKLAEEELEEADRCCEAAWLHAQFARGIFDAETTEHYLGEGVFLELDDEISDWRKFALEEMAGLESHIISLRKEIADNTKKK